MKIAATPGLTDRHFISISRILGLKDTDFKIDDFTTFKKLGAYDI